MDYRRMYDDKEHLYAYDLDGREVTVRIEKVFAGELVGERGKKSKKPMVKFVGKDKKLALNKTNGKIISSLYGKDTENWVDKWITIYPTTTEFGGETVDCIRVRPQVPQPRTNGKNARNGNGGGNANGRREPQPDAAAPAAPTDAADVPCDTCGVAPCACADAAQEPSDAS